jgi:hypothetical protein
MHENSADAESSHSHNNLGNFDKNFFSSDSFMNKYSFCETQIFINAYAVFFNIILLKFCKNDMRKNL